MAVVDLGSRHDGGWHGGDGGRLWEGSDMDDISPEEKGTRRRTKSERLGRRKRTKNARRSEKEAATKRRGSYSHEKRQDPTDPTR